MGPYNPPEEIKRLTAIWEPYWKQIIAGKYNEVPKEALNAWKAERNYTISLGQ